MQDIWWNDDPRAVASRRRHYKILVPVSTIGFVVFLLIGRWAAAAFTLALLGIALGCGVTIDGTFARRVWQRVRRHNPR